MELEIWKDVVGYEGYYQVSNFSRVRSLDRLSRVAYGGERYIDGRILIPKVGTAGYLRVNLSVNGKVKTKNIHRLVMEAFVPNPENKKTINHKDGNRANCCLDNLEWATQSENVIHSFKVLGKMNPMQGKLGALHPTSKGVSQYSLHGEFIASYGSLAEAGRMTGIPWPTIAYASDREANTHGFAWKRTG